MRRRTRMTIEHSARMFLIKDFYTALINKGDGKDNNKILSEGLKFTLAENKR